MSVKDLIFGFNFCNILSYGKNVLLALLSLNIFIYFEIFKIWLTIQKNHNRDYILMYCIL